MKYSVLLEVDSTIMVDVEADSPEEAMEMAHWRDGDPDTYTVNGFRALRYQDEKGEWHDNEDMW